ncbi:uncharacterized protein [Pituophis catenifer annectens]|uniref:uncharacterized protein n=1 Tax=Pituophis catenifer annectens TaxID=94852 RepID=UPI0039929F01
MIVILVHQENFQMKELYHFLSQVSFNNSAGDKVSFDKKGELLDGFDIINWITFPNKSFMKVKVGQMDPQAPSGRRFSINERKITWPAHFNQSLNFNLQVPVLCDFFLLLIFNPCITRLFLLLCAIIIAHQAPERKGRKGSHFVAMIVILVHQENFQMKELYHFLSQVSFNNSAGDKVSFDKKGELLDGFDIINWITFPNKSFMKVKVGQMDPQAPSGRRFSINERKITWPAHFNQTIPLALCNHHCPPGSRKKRKEGKPFCCYDCNTCPSRKFSNERARRYQQLSLGVLTQKLPST